jgi:hypothetical protein
MRSSWATVNFGLLAHATATATAAASVRPGGRKGHSLTLHTRLIWHGAAGQNEQSGEHDGADQLSIPRRLHHPRLVQPLPGSAPASMPCCYYPLR